MTHKTSLIIFALMCVLLQSNVYASSLWRCFAFNADHKSYEGHDLTQYNAMKIAKNNCLRQNSRASTCRTAESFCSRTYVALSEQECVVVDNKGESFTAYHCKEAVSLCRRWQYKHGYSRGGGCVAKIRRI